MRLLLCNVQNKALVVLPITLLILTTTPYSILVTVLTLHYVLCTNLIVSLVQYKQSKHITPK